MIQTKITKDIYHGDGTTRRFEITFEYNIKDDVKQIDLYTCTYTTVEGVTKYNNDVTKITSNYDFEVIDNVTYAVYPSDAAVSDGATPMATGTAIIIMRNTPNEQLSTGQYTSDKVEKQLDRLTMVQQELQEQLNRAYQAPEYVDKVNKADFATVANDIDAVNTVAAITEDIDLVNSNAENITTVAQNIEDVNATGQNIEDVNTVALNINDVSTVAGVSTDVTQVAGIANAVQTVSNSNSEVLLVADNLASVNTVANNVSDVQTVAGIASDVPTVASNATDISTVADNINDVKEVVDNIDDVKAAADAVEEVLPHITEINNVSDNINDIVTVASIDSDVSTVATNSSDISSVADNATNINTVATNISNVNTAASNMTAIIAAPDAATNAANSALNASTSATNAQKWAEGTDADVQPLGGTKSSKGWANRAQELVESIGTVMRYKGSVANYAALQAIQNPTLGDTYNVLDTGANYAWDGTAWDEIGSAVDLSAYRTAAQQDVIDSGKQATLVSGTNIKTINNTSLLGSGDISITPSSAWGSITGDLEDQTDLQNELDSKAPAVLLSYFPSDHIINEMSFLRADTFSWHSGDMYTAVYNHLVNDLTINVDTLYCWYKPIGDVREVYTIEENPSVGDNVYTIDNNGFAVFYDTIERLTSTGITTTQHLYNYERYSDSDLINQKIMTVSPQTETISGYTITYYKTADKHKICLADQETTVQNIYNESGAAWYYILDTTNTRFKLPRDAKEIHGELVESYYDGKSYCRIYSDGWCEQGGVSNTFFAASNQGYEDVNLLVPIQLFSDVNNYTVSVTKLSGSTGNTYGVSGNCISSSVLRLQNNGSIAGYISWRVNGYCANTITSPYQRDVQYKYLYFYVGTFTKTAYQETAGLNAELFNGKVDLDASNLSDNGKSLISSLSMPSEVYDNLTIPASDTDVTAPANGYYLASGTSGYIYLANKTTTFTTMSSGGSGIVHHCWIQARKGDTVNLWYSSTTMSVFKFFYAEGSKHEA